MQPSHATHLCASRYPWCSAASCFSRRAVFFLFLSLVASGDVKSTDVALQTLSAQRMDVRRPRYVDRTLGRTPIIMMVTAEASTATVPDFQTRIPSLLAFYSTVRGNRGATATSHMYGRGPQRCSWRVTRTSTIFSASSQDMIPSNQKTVDSRNIREGGDRSRRAGETKMDTEDPLKLKLPGGEVELHRIANGLAQVRVWSSDQRCEHGTPDSSGILSLSLCPDFNSVSCCMGVMHGVVPRPSDSSKSDLLACSHQSSRRALVW